MDNSTARPFPGLILLGLIVAALSFFLTSQLFNEARAGSEHYASSNWAQNPKLWMNSNMYSPLNTYAENATFSVDDEWDAVSGGWVNILVQGKKALPHAVILGDVPDGEIWVTDFYTGCSSSYGCTLGQAQYGVKICCWWDIRAAKIYINEDNDIKWNAHNDATMPKDYVDILSVLVHEVGHAMGMQHNNGSGGTCPGATSNSTDWTNQLTMCSIEPIWTGSGTVFPAGRTPRSHEDIDYAALY